MNRILFIFLIISLASCASKYRPYFFTKKGEKKAPDELIKSLKIKLDPIKDIRVITDRHLLTWTKPLIQTGDGKFCINAEKQYSSTYWDDVTNIARRYLGNFLGVQKVSVLIQDYDYRLSWSISEYKIKQNYSEEANKNRNNSTYIYYNSGAIGGLIGAVANNAFKGNSDMIFKTKGDISIVIDGIVLYNKEGGIVEEFEKQTLLLEDFELLADADCVCAYFNLDFYFKKSLEDFAPKLIEVLQEEMTRQN